MAYSIDINKLRQELHKLTGELNRLSQSVQPQAKAKFNELKRKVTELQKRWMELQKEADKEVTRTLSSIKTLKAHAEKIVKDALKSPTSKVKNVRKKTRKKAKA